jgi:hypothetical protein
MSPTMDVSGNGHADHLGRGVMEIADSNKGRLSPDLVGNKKGMTENSEAGTSRAKRDCDKERELPTNETPTSGRVGRTTDVDAHNRRQ